MDGRDAGIDLVTRSKRTDEFHAIQCKLYAAEHNLQKKDKDCGIVNHARDWAFDSINNPRCPLGLFLRVITVTLETLKTVNGLPKLDILSQFPQPQNIIVPA